MLQAAQVLTPLDGAHFQRPKKMIRLTRTHASDQCTHKACKFEHANVFYAFEDSADETVPSEKMEEDTVNTKKTKKDNCISSNNCLCRL